MTRYARCSFTTNFVQRLLKRVCVVRGAAAYSTGKFMAFQHYDGLSPDLILIGKSAQVCGVLTSPSCRLRVDTYATFHQTERTLRLKALLMACSNDTAAHFRAMHPRICAALAAYTSASGVDGAFWGAGAIWFITFKAYQAGPQTAAWVPLVYTGKVVRVLFGYEPLDALDERLQRDWPPAARPVADTAVAEAAGGGGGAGADAGAAEEEGGAVEEGGGGAAAAESPPGAKGRKKKRRVA